MSSRAMWASLLMLATTVPLTAQELELEIQQRIDSLVPLVEEAARAAEAARRTAQEAARVRTATRRDLDTLYVSGMRIVAPRADATEARELFREAWEASFVGLDSRTLPEQTFTYQRAAYDVDEIFVDGHHQKVVVPVWYPSSQAALRIRGAIGQAIAVDLADTELGRWLHGSPFTVHDPARLYREAILANSLAVQRCMDGDVAACTSSLGLELGADVLDVWYTPEQRRARVLEWAGYVSPPGRGGIPARFTRMYGAAFERCALSGVPEACDVFMESSPEVWSPLPLYVRETLVSLALERGGPGAWARLVQDPARSPEEALAYAAGVSLDELVSEWRSWVVTNRPAAYAGLAGKSALSLLWILFFGALATRSSRWRSE